MTYQLIRGDATSIPLADDSVDAVVTSPPYFSLRQYTDGGEAYEGQIGSEATPQAFLEAMWGWTAECRRVLKPSGSLWVNLGDKYAGGGGYSPDSPSNQGNNRHGDGNGGSRSTTTGGNTYGMKPKSLMGLPWRYAIGCIDNLGLILRAEVIWSKPNGLPESVTDRVRRSHEQWFCFQQSGGEVVEPGPQALPLCTLCGRPADTRATLVARLHEAESGVEDIDLPDEVGSDERVQGDDSVGAEKPGVVGLGGTAVPLAVPIDGDGVEDATDLLDDSGCAVVNQDAEMGAAGASVAEGDGTLAVDDSGQPGEVCRCSHPFIIDDEPWIPQELAAELMQMVADGEADAQAVADYLSGNYARTHSTWFHFTKAPRYFSAVDEIREEYDAPTATRTFGNVDPSRGDHGKPTARMDAAQSMNPLGKLPGSVWSVPTEPLRVPDHLGVDHFAAFPSEWPRRLILGWSPSGVCVECGEGRRPVVAKEKDVYYGEGQFRSGAQQVKDGAAQVGWKQDEKWRTTATITGYACACPDTTAPTRPAVILDPFSGTGTVPAVAHALGRHGIGIDLSADYLRLAEWRCNDPALRAKVLGVDKPKPVIEGQTSLFDEVA